MKRIGIIGLGNMGEAILKSLLEQGISKASILCYETNPERAEYIETTYKLTVSESLSEFTARSPYLIIAVKPQDSRDLLKKIAPYVGAEHIVISIMAGVTVGNILSRIGVRSRVVRVMPNIGVKVAQGLMGVAYGALADPERQHINDILAPLGKIIEVDEGLMDAVTALGGSGPAFFLLFFEAMIDAGVNLGIPRDKSRIMCSQVVRGTMKILEEEGTHPAVLKEMIASPGGTTMAGLAFLEKMAFKGNIIKAVEDAARRSKELSQ